MTAPAPGPLSTARSRGVRLLVLLSFLALVLPLARVLAAPPLPVRVNVLERPMAGASPVLRQVTASSPEEAERLVAELQASGRVLAASREATARILASDPRRGDQWGLDRLEAERVNARWTGSGQVVAVVDTGVDASHPDLAGAVLPGFDAYDAAGNGRVDPNGHGTHVAGVLGASAGNGVGIAGLSPGVRVLPVRVLDADGEGEHSAIARGVIWAADNGADVMNLSLGGDEDTAVLREAVAYARSRGVVVVAAAGNSATDGNPVMYPAAYPGVVAVAASTQSDTRAIFSETGAFVDVAAPGLSVLSTYPGGNYAYLSGTSMAAPFVAGAAALVREAHPSMTESQVAARLVSSAQDVGRPGRDDDFGSGILDPWSAATDGVPRKAPAPSFPRLPSFPDAPTVPSMPPLPRPALPDVPGLPRPSLPSNPDLPTPRLVPYPEQTLPALPGLPSNVSPISSSVSDARIVHGAQVVVSGTLAADAGARAKQQVELAVRPHGAREFTVAATSRTDGDGRVAFRSAPSVSADFVLRVASGPHRGSVSRTVHVDVGRKVTLSAAKSEGALTLSGRVSPSGGTVTLEQLRSQRWVPVRSLTPDAAGRFRANLPVSRSSALYRASASSVPGLAAGTSKPVSVLP